jgi:hypothetical protein
MVILNKDLNMTKVLFSIVDQRWKLADVGCSAEGTSKQLRPTDNGRGTGSYRCPELLQEERLYNNKADIWAFGSVKGFDRSNSRTGDHPDLVEALRDRFRPQF